MSCRGMAGSRRRGEGHRTPTTRLEAMMSGLVHLKGLSSPRRRIGGYRLTADWRVEVNMTAAQLMGLWRRKGSAKQRSIRFDRHGGKSATEGADWGRGRCEPGLTLPPSCGWRNCPTTAMRSGPSGTQRSISFRKSFPGPVAACSDAAMTKRDIDCESVTRSVATIVRAPLGDARNIGRTGCVRSSSLEWLFVQSTGRAVRRREIQASMSRTLCTKCGSLALERLRAVRLEPKAPQRQTRRRAKGRFPKAIERNDQWLPSAGDRLSVRFDGTLATLIVRERSRRPGA